MSLGIVRQNDICTGHGCFPPRPNASWSNNVFVNGLGIHRKTDRWRIHCCRSCHDGQTTAGSQKAFSNGLEIARKNDQISCGSKCMTHSENVFCN
ncbi:MAG: PAAR domain-containing protein [Candidatus Dojkabacteria bacterium]|nr:PAAR domain-containing protein [Candidatus Dojkabacteria bacterium]